MSLKQTPLMGSHTAAGARMVEYAGWRMPIHYPGGVIAEHLATRCSAGLFDVSHMGRLRIGGPDALPFLQRVLTTDVENLQVGKAHYALISSESGGAVDDVYLYRPRSDEYVLVVNASNFSNDMVLLRREAGRFRRLSMVDVTRFVAMLALQGPQADLILSSVIDDGSMPGPQRNALSFARLASAHALISRTGYTGEPVRFEMFMEAQRASRVWEALRERGATPAGLGARDTLRLEAGLPLYGYELGRDSRGVEIPIFALATSRRAVTFSSEKGAFLGRRALQLQLDELLPREAGTARRRAMIDRVLKPIALSERGVARSGARIFRGGREVGVVTSGTAVPYARPRDAVRDLRDGHYGIRSIALAFLDVDLSTGEPLEVRLRNSRVPVFVVDQHLCSEDGRHAEAAISWRHHTRSVDRAGATRTETHGRVGVPAGGR